MKLDVLLSDTHKQKEQRNRKEKRRLYPLGARAETQDWKTVLCTGILFEEPISGTRGKMGLFADCRLLLHFGGRSTPPNFQQ